MYADHNIFGSGHGIPGPPKEKIGFVATFGNTFMTVICGDMQKGFGVVCTIWSRYTSGPPNEKGRLGACNNI